MQHLRLHWSSLVVLLLTFGVFTDAKRIHRQFGDDKITEGQLRDNRIVGGQEADEGEAPYIVSIQAIWGSHVCGGVILNESWILTAGHCMLDFNLEQLRVIVGTNNRTEPGQTLQPDLSLVHCMYDIPAVYANDIAVVRLNGTIKFNNRTQPVTFSQTQPPHGETVRLLGWGSPKLNNPTTEMLQRIDLKIFDHKACKAAWDDNEGVDIGHICTLTQEGEGACNGDSGGPLIWQGKLIGLVNWGAPCAVGKPDMYANTVYYRDWIRRTTSLCKTLRG